MLRLHPAYFLLVLAVAFAGCDVFDNDEDDLFGEFRADVVVEGQVEGDRLNDDEDEDDRRLRGEAVYTIVQTAHGPELVIGLFVGDLFDSQYDEYQFISFRRKGGLPGVGAYAIDRDPQRAAVTSTYARVLDADEPEESAGPLLYGETGTLAISQVDPVGVITGSFRFDARGVFVENTGRFVEGTANGEVEARYERPELLLGRGLSL